MFSDGYEGFDKCLKCNNLFEQPLVLTKSTSQWVESLGPEAMYTTEEYDSTGTGKTYLDEHLQKIDKRQFKDTSDLDRDAIYHGFCSAKCQIKKLDKDNDKMINKINKLELQLAETIRESVDDLKDADDKISDLKEEIIDLEAGLGSYRIDYKQTKAMLEYAHNHTIMNLIKHSKVRKNMVRVLKTLQAPFHNSIASLVIVMSLLIVIIMQYLSR